MLLVSILIFNSVMQHFIVVKGSVWMPALCNSVDCLEDCKSDFIIHAQSDSIDLPFHLQNSTDTHAKHDGHTTRNRFLMDCCKTVCNQNKNCSTSDGETYQNGAEWMNADEPCLTHVCRNGEVLNHMSACIGLPCPREYHIILPSECCPSCDSSWASFCSEVSDCDLMCDVRHYKFKRDEQRNCELCECTKIKTQTSTTTSTTVSPSSPAIDDASNFYNYLDRTDGATKNLLIGAVVAFGVFFIVCIIGMIWYFRRKLYKQIPSVNLNNSSS